MDKDVSESLVATARVLESIAFQLQGMMVRAKEPELTTLSACVVALARLAGAHRKAADTPACPTRLGGRAWPSDDGDFHREEDAREIAAGREP